MKFSVGGVWTVGLSERKLCRVRNWDAACFSRHDAVSGRFHSGPRTKT